MSPATGRNMEGIMNALLLGLGVFIFTTTALFVLKNLIGGSITTNAWKPNVPYTRLVSESIKFTGSFLADKNIKKYPPFKMTTLMRKEAFCERVRDRTCRRFPLYAGCVCVLATWTPECDCGRPWSV